MRFNSIADLKRNEFTGFIKIEELHKDRTPIPKSKGVYLVIRKDTKEPMFVRNGSAGHIAERNPNVTNTDLKKKWVSGPVVMYIGKAGGDNQKATLNGRINAYLRHGRGHSARHWGGRYIWQLKNSGHLLICWKCCDNIDPRTLEKELIMLFKNSYNKLPFANLVH